MLGQSFQIPALSAVSGVPAGELAGRLDRLVRSDLVRVEVDPRSPERGQYAFLQALIREVAYATLALRDRRTRHLAAARHFESIGDEELAGALAAHYLAAYRASSEGPEADALAGQARIALRAAAERATSLGSLAQAVTFLEQAAEVTPDPAERAELHERAGNAARSGGRAAQGLRHFELAFDLLDELGDRSGQARVAAFQGAALNALRRRDEAFVHLQAAFAEFEDLGDENPDLVVLMRWLVVVASLLDRHDVADPIAARQLASAERLGLADLAAAALLSRGQAALYAGRGWEARALTQGALELFEEAGDIDSTLQAASLLATIVALDSPAKSVTVQRDALDLARRQGRRSTEALLVGNASEDARRTGDWEWAEAQLAQLLEADVDPETSVMALGGVVYFRLYRGEAGIEAVDELRERLRSMSDSDLDASVADLEGVERYLAADWAAAVPHHLHAAEISPLNLPYILPNAGRVGRARGRPGRPPSRSSSACAGTGSGVGRSAPTSRWSRPACSRWTATATGRWPGTATRWRRTATSGCAWDEARLGLEVAQVLGADDPEVAAWVERSRVVFARLGARVDARAARPPAGRGRCRRRRDGASRVLPPRRHRGAAADQALAPDAAGG